MKTTRIAGQFYHGDSQPTKQGLRSQDGSVTGVEYSYPVGKREEQEMRWFGVVITGLFSLTSIAGYALVGYILFMVASWALSLF
jgi:hypothetical protein